MGFFFFCGTGQGGAGGESFARSRFLSRHREIVKHKRQVICNGLAFVAARRCTESCERSRLRLFGETVWRGYIIAEQTLTVFDDSGHLKAGQTSAYIRERRRTFRSLATYALR